MRVVPQVFPTASGERLITYAVFYRGVFVGYSRCFCGAIRLVRLLQAQAIARRGNAIVDYDLGRLGFYQ